MVIGLDRLSVNDAPTFTDKFSLLMPSFLDGNLHQSEDPVLVAVQSGQANHRITCLHLSYHLQRSS